ncbi:MAG: hypothetical protein EZS28_017356, partial [Streblomastix strix]
VFDPNRRISAEQALQHPYFTSPQAQAEISPLSRQIAQNALAMLQIGQQQITQYDMEVTFTVPTSEIMTFLSMNPEAEQQKILSTRQNQQYQQPTQITPQIQQSVLSISGFANNEQEQEEMINSNKENKMKEEENKKTKKKHQRNIQKRYIEKKEKRQKEKKTRRDKKKKHHLN